MLSKVISKQRDYYTSALVLDDIPNEINAMIITFALDAFIETNCLVDIAEKPFEEACTRWCIGRVQKIGDGVVLVEYLGWAYGWSEILSDSSPRLAALNSRMKLESYVPVEAPSTYSYNMSIEALKSNIEHLMELGYADRDQLADFFLHNGSYTARRNIVNILVYWRLVSKNLHPLFVRQLEKLHVVQK